MPIVCRYKHEQLTELLRNEIIGDNPPGYLLPTQKQLMNTYHVSQATINSAMQPLYDEGLIYSITGRGTFINRCHERPSASDSAIHTVHCIVSKDTVFSADGNPRNWFSLSEIVKGAASASAGRNCTFHLTPLSPYASEEHFTDLCSVSGTAFIFLECKYFEPLIRYCLSNQRPYSVYGMHRPREKDFNQVWLDVAEGSRQMTAFLIRRGHRRIGFLGDAQVSRRFSGFCNAMTEAGLHFADTAVCFTGHYQPEKAKLEAMRLLNENTDLTALVCSNDWRAKGAWDAAQQLGRRIEITGMDNFYPECPWFSLNLEFARIGKELYRLAEESVSRPAQNLCVVPHWEA